MKPDCSRNSCLDLIKGVACMFVIFLHAGFPGVFGIGVKCIARVCVPFFFMAAGYFSWYPAPKQPRYGAKLRRIALITLGAVLFNLAANCVPEGFSWLSRIDWREISWVRFLLFNQPNIVFEHLWFLFALLYDYALWAFTDRFRLCRVAYLMIPVLLTAYFLLAQGAFFLGIRVPNYFYRNFLVEGFPFFMLGHLIHRKQERIRLTAPVLLCIFAASTLLCLLERALFGRDFGMHFFTVSQVISLFLLGVTKPSFGSGSRLAVFGRRYSLFVYVLHPFAVPFVHFLYKKLHLLDSVPAAFLQPITVLAVTAAASAFLLWLKEKLLPGFRKKLSMD